MPSSETKFRYKYFGYVLKEDWLLEYGVYHNLCPKIEKRKKNGTPIEDIDEVRSTISGAITHIPAKAGIALTSKLGTVKYKGEEEYCIVLATNYPLDNLPVPSPEFYARLKEVLGTTKEPQWYKAFA